MKQKKEGLTYGTKHTRERLPCFILYFFAFFKLFNLIARGGTPQPLGSYAKCQELIASLSTYLWLKHETFIVTLMSLRTWGSEPFRVITQRYASSFRSPQIEDTRALDPFCALAEFNVLLNKAKKMTSRELSRQTPDCIGAKLLIASTALRAYRNRYLWTLMRCCEAWKLIEACFDTSSFE